MENANIKIIINNREQQLLETLVIEKSIEENIPRTTFTIATNITFKPVMYDNVEVYDELNDIYLFKGILTNITISGQINGFQQMEVEAQGYKALLTKMQSLLAFPENTKTNDIIQKLITESDAEGIGAVGYYGITIGEIDDYSEYDNLYTGGTTYGSDSVRDTLDKLAELTFSYWYIDDDKKFYFKKIEDAPTFNHGNIPLEDFLNSKEISNFEVDTDHSLQRNAQTLFGKEVDTTQYIIDELRGQDDQREYVVGYKVSKNITVRISTDGGTTWINQSVGQKTSDGSEPNTQWIYGYGEQVIKQNSNEPTLPSTTIIEIKYIGLFSSKVRLTSEQVITQLAQRTGMPRPVISVFEEDDQANSQAELSGYAQSKLKKYTPPSIMFTIETRKPIGISIGEKLDTRDLIIKGYTIEDILLCESVTISIDNNVDNEVINPIYTYTFVINAITVSLASFIRKNRKQNFEQDDTFVDVSINTDVGVISIEFESVEFIDIDSELYAKQDLFASDDLFAGNGSVN